MPGADDAIMLCGVEIEFDSGFLAEIMEVSELGADRRTVDATTANSPDGWGEVLYSCIARMVPFNVTLAFNPSQRWDTAIKKAKEGITITWPNTANTTVPAELAGDGGLTGFRIRGSLEDRVMATATITPTGKWTVTPGTAP